MIFVRKNHLRMLGLVATSNPKVYHRHQAGAFNPLKLNTLPVPTSSSSSGVSSAPKSPNKDFGKTHNSSKM